MKKLLVCLLSFSVVSCTSSSITMNESYRHSNVKKYSIHNLKSNLNFKRSGDRATIDIDGRRVDLVRDRYSDVEKYVSSDARIEVTIRENYLYLNNNGNFTEYLLNENTVDSSRYSVYDSPVIRSRDKEVYNFKAEYGNSRIMIVMSPSYDVALVRQDGREFEVYRKVSPAGITFATPDNRVMYTISKGNLYLEERGKQVKVYYDAHTQNINYAR